MYISAAGAGWQSPRYFEPPSGCTFQHSPTVCILRDVDLGEPEAHLVAAADGRLWHTLDGESGWTAWEPIADADIDSSPDCTVSDDGALHVVAKTSSGSIVYVHGLDGEFAETDLGVFE